VNNRRGMALVLTLWILCALVILAAGLAMTAHTEIQVSRNYADTVQCRLAAHGGVNRGLADVEDPGFAAQGAGTELSSTEDGLDLGDASFVVQIQDEAGKVNINTAPESVLEAVFGSKEIAAAIVDWRDKDDDPRPVGAESEYYSGLEKPYHTRNESFITVREVLLVKGITKEALSSPATADGRTLEDMLTVYSRDKNVDAAGQERINIKTATKEVMKSRLGDALTDTDIDSVISWRGTRSLSSASEIALAPGLGRDKVKKIFDRITASDDKVRSGLVNINTAPAELLAALPGFDRRISEEVVSYRDLEGPLKDVGQLLDIPAVSTDVFARAADLLTARSRVFKIVSEGKVTRTASSESVVCVVDVTDGSAAQIKYWRE
jgi:general secretion pathway protein K